MIRWQKITFCILYEVRNNALYSDHIRLHPIVCDYTDCRIFEKFHIGIHYQIFQASMSFVKIGLVVFMFYFRAQMNIHL
jgi:hypothetical protein